MDTDDEADLRLRVSTFIAEWREQRRGRFRGESLSEFADMVEAAHVTHDESRVVLQQWVDAGRRAGMSWADIGALTGVTRQAAQQRFGGATDDSATDDGIVVRTGATALNEMRILAEEGAAKRELVAIGLLTLSFRQTAKPWIYRRIVAFAPRQAIAREKRAGWIFVAAWYPFLYFKRQTEPRA